MQSYLDNRYQRTLVTDSKSDKVTPSWEHIRHDVPQGSVHGPLLFLIYINDFPLTISKLANSIIFADDASIVVSNSNQESFRNSINYDGNNELVSE